MDPVVKTWESSYASFGNNPILLNDILGDDVKNGNKDRLSFGESKLYRAESKLKQAQKSFENYSDCSKSEIDALKSTNKNEYKNYKIAKANLGDAQDNFNYWNGFVSQQKELVKYTDKLIEEFKNANPEEFNKWDKLYINNQIVDVNVETQYQMITMKSQGKSNGETTEGIGTVPPADNRHSGFIELIGVYIYKANDGTVSVTTKNLNDLAHGLGHVNNKKTVSGGLNDEESADRYQQWYFKKKK